MQHLTRCPFGILPGSAFVDTDMKQDFCAAAGGIFQLIGEDDGTLLSIGLEVCHAGDISCLSELADDDQGRGEKGVDQAHGIVFLDFAVFVNSDSGIER